MKTCYGEPLTPCALDDTAHHREVLVTPATRSGSAENYERTLNPVRNMAGASWLPGVHKLPCSKGANNTAVGEPIFAGVAVSQVAMFATTVYLHRFLAHGGIELRPELRAASRIVIWLTTAMKPRSSRPSAVVAESRSACSRSSTGPSKRSPWKTPCGPMPAGPSSVARRSGVRPGQAGEAGAYGTSS